MQSEEIRRRFIEFFKKRDHAVIPSASLVPQDDPSVLFTTAGMQPLVPYLLGAPHPKGRRLVGVQKCVRTQDIEEVGDNTHDTFFEMLGNWSLGDPKSPDGIGQGYFKEDAIRWSYEFLTAHKDKGGLGLDSERLYITVFGGNDNAQRDDESAEIWQKLGISKERIFFLEDNWWSPGESGPCGPDSEMFYDVTDKGLGELSHEEFVVADERQMLVEVWNDVFMEYEKKDGKVVGKLVQKNVDTGAGLERLAMVMQGKNNIFDTDLFNPVTQYIQKNSKKYEEKAARIIADHIRTSIFLVADGVFPSNKDRGYILRRLIRRASVYAQKIDITISDLNTIAMMYGEQYKNTYPEVFDVSGGENEIIVELKKFQETLVKGLKKFEEGIDPFILATTYGFPIELTKELVKERGAGIDEEQFNQEMKKHQELSRKGAEGKFKGGLADTDPKTVMLHTATHLMLAGLRKYLGDHVHQAGSNITPERTRFDFTHPEKVSQEILNKVEAYVNEAIQKNASIEMEKIPKQQAKENGVEGSFWEKYPDEVNVYKVVAPDGIIYSQELCGGPHVRNTGEIKGIFKITKEEASSSGVRRIKAVLE
ncbi:MAG: alanine--tRNA ligase [Candidatus Paceibacterota bacterium]